MALRKMLKKRPFLKRFRGQEEEELHGDIQINSNGNYGKFLPLISIERPNGELDLMYCDYISIYVDGKLAKTVEKVESFEADLEIEEIKAVRTSMLARDTWKFLLEFRGTLKITNIEA